MADLNEIMSSTSAAALEAGVDHKDGPHTHSGSLPREESGGTPAEPQAGAVPQPSEAQPGEGGKPPAGFVPIQALDEVRGENRSLKETVQALTRQFQQLTGYVAGAVKPSQEKPADDPNWFDDPDAAFSTRVRKAVDPLQQQMQQQREAFSEMIAINTFGEETVNSALAELTKRVNANPAAMRNTYDRIMGARHPHGELVRWFKQEQTLSRVGDDPDGFFAAEFKRRFNRDLSEFEGDGGQAQAGAQPQQRSNGQPMPTNLATARNAGPRSAPVWAGPKPLSEIMPR